MDKNYLLRRFDGRSRLLLHSLFSGIRGTSRAIQMFSRQRRSDPDLSLNTCLNILCQEEPLVNGDALSLAPLVCQFPVAFKCGLLSFLHVTHSLVPRLSLIQLLDCLNRDSDQSPWTQALLRQLCRDLGVKDPSGGELFTAECRSLLELLCTRRGGNGHILSEPNASQSVPTSTGAIADPTVQSHGKRGNESADLVQNVEGAESQSKRRRLDLPATSDVESESTAILEVGDIALQASPLVVTNTPGGGAMGQTQASAVSFSLAMPEHIKASVLRIKELLETDGEWDQDPSSVLQVLNECNPSQIELLCEGLQLSEVPEQTLPQFCTTLLTLSPDLSHSTAFILAKSLFYEKIVSLWDPASRSLVAAMTSFCSRYPRPICHALIGPILHTGQINSMQAELLCRVIRECLDSQYQLLVFRHTLEVPWSEELLLVVHTLLDSKLELTEESFTVFITHLCQQASHFIKSMKFAKMMLTLLTKYHSQVNVEHKQTLSSCLASHETFLKKSLLAALKRINPT